MWPRNLAAVGVVRITVWGPVHHSWRETWWRVLSRTKSPNWRGRESRLTGKFGLGCGKHRSVCSRRSHIIKRDSLSVWKTVKRPNSEKVSTRVSKILDFCAKWQCCWSDVSKGCVLNRVKEAPHSLWIRCHVPTMEWDTRGWPGRKWCRVFPQGGKANDPSVRV